MAATTVIFTTCHHCTEENYNKSIRLPAELTDHADWKVYLAWCEFFRCVPAQVQQQLRETDSSRSSMEIGELQVQGDQAP